MGTEVVGAVVGDGLCNEDAAAGEDRRRAGEIDGRLLGGLDESASLLGSGACCACMDSTWPARRSMRLLTATSPSCATSTLAKSEVTEDWRPFRRLEIGSMNI